MKQAKHHMLLTPIFFCGIDKDTLIHPDIYLIISPDGNIANAIGIRFQSSGQNDMREPKIYGFLKKEFISLEFTKTNDYRTQKIDVKSKSLSNHLANYLYKAIQTDPLTDIQYLNNLCELLLINLISHEQVGPFRYKKNTGFELDNIKYLQDYIECHLHEDISLKQLSSLVNLSVYHFSRLFKDAFGKSPYFYINGLKMEKAKILLKSGDLSIIQIGMSLGYSNPSHFSRVFKNFYSMSPRDYIKQLNKVPTP